MPLLVKLSTTLRGQVPGYDPLTGLDLEFVPGESAQGLIRRLGLDPARIKIIMVNGPLGRPGPAAQGRRPGGPVPAGGRGMMPELRQLLAPHLQEILCPRVRPFIR